MTEKVVIVHEQAGLVKQGCGCLSVWVGFQVIGILLFIAFIIFLLAMAGQAA